MCIPLDPAPITSLLGIYSKEIILGMCKDLFTKRRAYYDSIYNSHNWGKNK